MKKTFQREKKQKRKSPKDKEKLKISEEQEETTELNIQEWMKVKVMKIIRK